MGEVLHGEVLRAVLAPVDSPGFVSEDFRQASFRLREEGSGDSPVDKVGDRAVTPILAAAHLVGRCPVGGTECERKPRQSSLGT